VKKLKLLRKFKTLHVQNMENETITINNSSFNPVFVGKTLRQERYHESSLSSQSLD